MEMEISGKKSAPPPYPHPPKVKRKGSCRVKDEGQGVSCLGGQEGVRNTQHLVGGPYLNTGLRLSVAVAGSGYLI